MSMIEVVRILHYHLPDDIDYRRRTGHQNPFDGFPSFVLVMSDNKKYISSGGEWEEVTTENLDYLTHWHGKGVEDVFLYPSVGINDVYDASYMFSRSHITNFNWKMDNVEYAENMFSSSSLQTFHSRMPKLRIASGMFWGSNLEKFSIEASSIEKYGDYMIFDDTPYRDVHTSLDSYFEEFGG